MPDPPATLARSLARSLMAAASWSWGAPSEGTSADTGLLAYFRSGLSGYVPLRSSARSNEEEAYLSLSHWER